MAKKSLDLTTLLPKQYRDKTLDSLLKNTFNRHVSKTDTSPVFGYLGDGELETGEISIQESSLERQINQITSLIYAEHATEKKVFSWPDLLQKLVLLGVDYNTIGSWFKTGSYNFVPPIDLDKFCNFNEYFWIGDWIQKAPNLPYYQLGIPKMQYVLDSFARTNSEYVPEYYTIRRPMTMMESGDYSPIAPTPNLNHPNNPQRWSDWSLTNLWVHKQDAISFIEKYGSSISFSDVVQATRPIIEYSSMLRLNTYQTATGLPTDAGNYRTVIKSRSNQPPLFDIYLKDGTHSGYASSIFYYVEGSQYPVDAAIQRRVATDENNDFIFEHSLVGENSELLFYQTWDGINFNLQTIWRQGLEIAPRYLKYDNSGTLINQDKFTNYRNYYWTGLQQESPIYNSTGLPEYTVIEIGGASDWSIYNRWVHVSQLKRSDLSTYVQATRPIIEFNKNLEAELVEGKQTLGQLPRFKTYAYDRAVSRHVSLQDVSSTLRNLNDAYLKGAILAHLDDLGPEVKEAVMTTPALLKQTFEAGGQRYLQGLRGGRFVPEKDGNVYGYTADVINFLGDEKGTVVGMTLQSSVTPEIVTLTYDLATNLFRVVGSISGTRPDLVPGSIYTSNTGLSFTLTVGDAAFEHGDTIVLNVKSFVYIDENVYVRMNGDYRTVTEPSGFIQEEVEVIKLESNPLNRDGVWEVPPQIEWNVKNETRQTLKQGDLYFHFVSIIENQVGLLGSATGNNNYRNLTARNVGLGGTIKQYDGNAALLISLLIQEGITVPTILEFARQSYENLFSSVRLFIEDKIPQMLTDVQFTPPQQGDEISVTVVNAFKEFFKTSSAAKYANTGVGGTKSIFFDSISPIEGLVATLPYLGLAPRVFPQKVVDLELNLPMMVHHDGHRSRLSPQDVNLLKAIVTKKFKRSPGQESTGSVSGFDFPSKPYKGQFWFKTSTSQLFYYNVVSETGEQPENVPFGSYSYNRDDDSIWQFNGEWNRLGFYEINLPWTEVRVDLIEQNLILALERELWEKCPPLSSRLSALDYETNHAFVPNMKKELERFGVIYGTPDVYSSAYNASNAFTWNYRSTAGLETWNEIYRQQYGTPRPDLQPWIPAGYANEVEMMGDLHNNGLIPGSTASWTPALWMISPVLEFLRTKYVAHGKPSKMSVDISNGALLPPYSVYPEGFYSTVPTTASDPFSYGGMGPIETYWRKTLNYLYSAQKTYFKINPLKYVLSTWGIRYETVGNYVLNASLGRKESPADFQIHGDLVRPLQSSASLDSKFNSLLTVSVLEYPDCDLTYKFTCVNRRDDLFAVSINGELTGYAHVGVIYSDVNISVYIAPKIDYYYNGDTFTVEVGIEGVPTVASSFAHYLKVEGLNQLYVQYRRLYGEDAAIAVNQTLFKGWDIKTGYRFGSMVNTDSLMLKSQDELIDSSSYQVLIKENKFYDSSWLNALKIQLVQKGSTLNGMPRAGASGVPGDDWVFRVDNFNDARTEIEWFRLDTNGSVNTFVAMGGAKTLHSWNHYLTPIGTMRFNAPFLIRGIQNVVNFLYGFAAKLEAEGWRFNDQNNQVIDPVTGRPTGFQLLIEQFVNQQFLNVDAGSVFVVNPFSRKVWFTTPHGFLTDLYTPLGIEQETVCTILDQTQRPITKNEIRVFRQDDLTEIIFDRPAYTVHALVGEYEHVVLFDNYADDTLLMYDPFLGQRTDKIFVSGEKQATYTGRLDFGGHFLIGDQMKKNLENSIQSILTMYDSSGKPATSPDSERARSLLGFKKKDYFESRGSTDATEFRFWQGMIANKGTNFAVDAYVNSSQFKSAKLDEYWAYKVAEYGDARSIKKSEMRIVPTDGTAEHTKFLFLENDELNLVKWFKKNGGFDVSNLGITAYDVATLYTEVQTNGFDYVDLLSTVVIRPDDEERWFRYDDLRSFEYFESSVLAEYHMVADNLDKIYLIYDAQGELVRADTFEIVDLTDPERLTYYEMGEISDADPYDLEGGYGEHYYDQWKVDTVYPDYEQPKFKRINHHTIQILDDRLIGRPLKVIAYGPAFSRYSPSQLIDHRNNVMVRDDVIWWDPARGVHHPQAFNEIDYVSDKNPARYNQSLLTYKNPNVELMKPWGEEQVGKIWWNTKGLDYQPYSDTKIVNDMNERVNSWGAISDASTIEVYEWVRSSAPPEEYEKTGVDTDGNVALRDILTRKRTWYQRPVAWKFSPNPVTEPRAFSAYQPARLRIEPLTGNKARAILDHGDFAATLARGCKIAGAIYSSQSKTDASLLAIYGTAKITSEPSVVIGTTAEYSSGANFSTNPYFTVDVEVDSRIMSFKKKNFLGEYVVTSEQDGADYFIRLTHRDSGETQRVQIRDLPVLKGTQDSYIFEQFGLIINCTSLLNRDDINGSTESTRMKHIAISLALDHDIFLRSAVEIEVMIPFDESVVVKGAAEVSGPYFLDGSTDISKKGWIGWKDPEKNPNAEFEPPLNRFAPFVGEWTVLDGHLADLASDVRARMQDPWTWFDGTDYNSYKYEWSFWKKMDDAVVVDHYNPIYKLHDDYIRDKFLFPSLSATELKERTQIFVNESELRPAQWKARTKFNGPYQVGAYPEIPLVNIGDRIKVIVHPRPVGEEDLKFDPAVQDNMFKNVQYKINYPHVFEERRDQSDRLTHKYYYFWVKNKLAPSKIKRMSVSKVSDLIHHHEGMYGVPQIFKQYNQIDGRPNRYAVLSVRGLGRYVSDSNMYKLRITDNGTLRNDDRNLDLKNKHVEWVLLRKNQATKVSLTLWNKLIDTMIGQTADGRTLLPFTPLSKYDARNGTNDSFGFGDGQIMTDTNLAIATVINTLREIIDRSISDPTYDVSNQLRSVYLGVINEGTFQPQLIRSLMSDLWRFAKAKEVNEIFFAVLEDTAAKNLEIADFFKTSFISLEEVKTIVIDDNGAQQNGYALGSTLGLPTPSTPSPTPSPTPTPSPSPSPSPTPTPVGPPAAFKLGVTLSAMELGSSPFPGVFGTQYGTPTLDDITYLHNKGINLFRIPFRWERIQSTLFGELDDQHLDTFAALANHAHVLGGEIILEMHNFGTYELGGNTYFLNGPDQTIRTEHFVDVWKKIAEVMQGMDGLRGYDIMGEPMGDMDGHPETWQPAAQAAIDAIRTVDFTSTIYVEGLGGSSAANWTDNNENFTVIDPVNNLIYTANFFLDGDDSGNHTNYDTEGGDANVGVERAQVFVDWLNSFDPPRRGQIGKMGAPNTDSRWLVAMDNAIAYLAENDVEYVAWVGGEALNSSPLSLYPNDGYDARQMAVLTPYARQTVDYYVPEPTKYILTAPATAAQNWIIEYRGILGSAVTFFPSDAGAGGTFSQLSVTMQAGRNPIATFKYTPPGAGTYHVTCSNTGGLVNPAPVAFTQ